MCKAHLNSLLLTLSLGMIACGCGDQKKGAGPAAVPPVSAPMANSLNNPAASEKTSEIPTQPDKPMLAATKPEAAASNTPASPVVPATGETKPNPPPASPAATVKVDAKPRQDARPFGEAAFIPNEIVGLLVVHPKQFFDSPIGQLLKELGFEQDSGEPAELLRRLQLKLDEMERVTIVIDQAMVNTAARQAGLPVVEGAAAAAPAGKNQLKNTLKQFGLAFHNYHDVFQKFPRADGDGSGQHTGLSWRVHLLPFLDQAPLYNQFHFDEAWDSDHNKTLIAQMPAIFKSPGVTDEEKKAFHVFTGENTLFYGEQGIGIRNITDGTSNTILAVLAGADTAEIWTKPGGLEVDLSSPKKALGDVKDEKVLVLIADGSIRELPADIDETMLANLIQPADGNVVDFGDHNHDHGHGQAGVGAPFQRAISLPPLILTLASDAKPSEMLKGILGESTEETHEGQSFHKNETMAMWFPNGQTVVAGPIESVKQMISAKQSGKASTSPLIDQLQLGADYTVAIDMESQASLIGQVVQFNPMMGMISNIKSLSAHFSAAGKEGDSLVEVNVTALDAGMANGLSAVATMGLNQGKMAFGQFPEAPNANASDKEMQALLKQLVASATVKQDGDKIQFRIPTPSGFDRIPALLKPALVNARAAAKAMQQRNALKQLGLAFHNFHDTYNTFPGAGRMRREQPIGLSWRVSLLPYLNQAPLYNQFKMDEPWDSEHNKALIEKMPELFKTPGVDEVGKTSIHVFTGPGSPFADDATPGLREFTDGSSNTILAVLAGPDTAEIWTKPGGLDFDTEDPIKALGNLVGESFEALMADGAVRAISKKLDAPFLRRLIQHNDGEPVPPF